MCSEGKKHHFLNIFHHFTFPIGMVTMWCFECQAKLPHNCSMIYSWLICRRFSLRSHCCCCRLFDDGNIRFFLQKYIAEQIKVLKNAQQIKKNEEKKNAPKQLHMSLYSIQKISLNNGATQKAFFIHSLFLCLNTILLFFFDHSLVVGTCYR